MLKIKFDFLPSAAQRLRVTKVVSTVSLPCSGSVQ